MNIRQVFNLLSLLMLALSGIMAGIGVFAAISLLTGDASEAPAMRALFISAGIGLVCGGAGWWRTREKPKLLGRREALLLVAMSWFVGAVLAAMPFLLWAHTADGVGPHHEFRNVADCYFEAMSGLSTTGATILSDIHTLPRSIILWRAVTHWLGGLGIVVLFVAVLPSLGVGGKKLFRVEVTGPTPGGVRPHIRDTARILWLIYVGLTITQVLAMRLAGVPWFEGICYTFSCLSTGGLAPHNASIGYYDSIAVDMIIVVFMIAAGVNFGLYYQAMRGKLSTIWKDTELRVYLALKVIAIMLVAITIFGLPIVTTTGQIVDGTVGQTLRYSTFSIIAMHTGTGFCTADFNIWPYFARIVVIGLMFIGGCGGSTAGGIKVIRFWIGLKILASELERTFRPNVVRPVKVGNAAIDADLKLTTMVFLLSFAILWGLGAFLLMLFESPAVCNPVTAMTASLATLANVGPGLGLVGPTENYGWFSAPSKYVMSALMALGRLEVFTVLVLCTPRFWRGD